MSTEYNFRGRSKVEGVCGEVPPELGCYDCDPCEPSCNPKCPPKVRAKEAICLSDDEYERCFSVHSLIGCSREKVPAMFHRIGLEVRAQGFCTVLARECPLRADINGNACFQWSQEFRELEAGYYEADIFFDGCLCGVLLFRKTSCWVGLESEEVSLSSPCSPVCSSPATGCIPLPDIEPDGRLGDCNYNECEDC